MGNAAATPTPFEPLYDVAIVGAGFSGSLTAVHLLTESGEHPPPRHVALIEKEPAQFGRGVAYGTGCPRHLLNVPAGKMGAFPDRPEHFLAWLRAHPGDAADFGLDDPGAGAFVPRALYGRYVATLLAEAEAGGNGRLRRIVGEAVDVTPIPGEPAGPRRIELADGRCLRAHRIVLAVGNFPPGDPRLRDERFHRCPRYLYSPWSAETHERLAAPGDALILGSGLTGLDLLLTLRGRKREGTLHVLSRHGLFPLPHRPGLPAWPAFLQAGELPRTVRALFREVRAEVARAAAAGTDWRPVVDALRPFTQEAWQRLPDPERRRFQRHLRALWEPHRHRAAPEALAVKDELERTGRVVCHRARVDRIAEAAGGAALDVSFKPRGAARGERRSLRVGYVVNCTGPECNYHRLGEPLVVSLFARGLARPDELLLGLDTAADGALRDERGVASERLFTLGSPRKGQLLETTAVPELRAQARELATLLRRPLAPAAPRRPPAPPRTPLRPSPAFSSRRSAAAPEHAFAFEI